MLGGRILMYNDEPICYNFCPKPGDYILFKYPLINEGREYKPEKMQKFHKDMVEKFPNNEVITVPQNIDLTIVEKEQIVKILRKMADNIEKEII